MKAAWTQHMILRAASLLAPFDQRAEWLDGWRSELWYIPRSGATRFCLGAFQDALWLRRNNLSTAKRSGIQLESPLACLAFLAGLAAVSLAIVARLPGPQWGSEPYLLRRNLPFTPTLIPLLEGCIPMLLLSVLVLPAIRLAMGPGANRCPIPWPGRLLRGIFLAAKIALVQPIMLLGFFVVVWTTPVVPVGPQFGVFGLWTLTFRWIILDQRQRCPVCLRLLTEPVRIGSASQTFLEWYGAESMCSRGHGLLHISETPGYSGRPHWLRLGDSWSGLFSEAAGVRHR